jgi:hypothetical protein
VHVCFGVFLVNAEMGVLVFLFVEWFCEYFLVSLGFFFFFLSLFLYRCMCIYVYGVFLGTCSILVYENFN